MIKAITRLARDKVWTIPISRLRPTNIGERLFAADDATAQRHGWQVTPVHGGLGRRYRDPRFDSLVRCAVCAGTGRTDGRAATPCAPCAGTGRRTLGQPAPVHAGPGHPAPGRLVPGQSAPAMVRGGGRDA